MPVEICGYPDLEEITGNSNFPSEQRRAKGKYVIIECYQEIPCNPCETICNKNAIKVGSPITNLPVYISDQCNGCGVCIAVCPGQAIFVVEENYEKKRDLVGFPYEYLPLPEKGQTVPAVNRAGEVVCEGIVERIITAKSMDKTNVVYLSVPRGMGNIVRSIKNRKSSSYEHVDNMPVSAPAVETIEKTRPEDAIVCRCEEVTVQDVYDAIEDGAIDVRGVKIRTRAGMGLCQGKSCEKQIQKIISQKTGAAPETILPDKKRPPVRAIDVYSMMRNRNEKD